MITNEFTNRILIVDNVTILTNGLCDPVVVLMTLHHLGYCIYTASDVIPHSCTTQLHNTVAQHSCTTRDSINDENDGSNQQSHSPSYVFLMQYPN